MKLHRLLLASWSVLAFAGQLHAQTVFPAPGAGGSGSGTVTSITASSPLTGGTITTSGSIGVGTIGVSNGGTGLTGNFTAGQVLIGNTTSGGLQAATLTAGSNVTITNGNGTISIAASGGGNSTGCTPPNTANQPLIADGTGNCTGISVGTTGQVFVGVTSAAPAFKTPATFQASTTSNLPAVSSSSVYTMAGLGGNGTGGLSAVITPAVTGLLDVEIECTGVNGTDTPAGQGMSVQMSWGTGTPPVSNAALTGTQVGRLTFMTNPAVAVSGAETMNFSTRHLIQAAVGTPTWVDLAQKGASSTTWQLALCGVTIVELP